MFGDFFGRQSAKIFIGKTDFYSLQIWNQTGGTLSANSFQGTVGSATLQPVAGSNLLLGNAHLGPTSITLSQPLTASALTVGNSFAITPSSAVTNAFSGQFVTAGNVANFDPARSQAVLVSTAAGGDPTFSVLESFQITNQKYLNVLYIANPSGGGAVGQNNIVDDNSPLPRDRIIFDYDYYNNTPLVPGKLDVRRYTLGFEKTFFNQSMSVEVLVPFASTLNSDLVADGSTDSRLEFGNLQVNYKALLLRTDMLNVSSGLGISIPTASDTKIRLTDGTDLVQIKNEALVLTPFVGALLTPTDRFFAQAWYQVGVAANGNPVLADPTLSGNLNRVGTLTDQVLMGIDTQMGFWLIRSNTPGRWLQGLAPFVEVHYNTAINEARIVNSGTVAIGEQSNQYNEFDVSTGVVAQFWDNLNLMTGIVAPITAGNNKSCDFQVGVRASWLFGPKVREQSSSTQ